MQTYYCMRLEGGLNTTQNRSELFHQWHSKSNLFIQDCYIYLLNLFCWNLHTNAF